MLVSTSSHNCIVFKFFVDFDLQYFLDFPFAKFVHEVAEGCVLEKIFQVYGLVGRLKKQCCCVRELAPIAVLQLMQFTVGEGPCLRYINAATAKPPNPLEELAL